MPSDDASHPAPNHPIPWRERDRLNQRRVHIWSVVWALSLVALTAAIRTELMNVAAVLAAAAVSAVFGLTTMMAYRRFVQQTDELRRKIELEALALAFGIGVVAGLTFWILLLHDIVSGRGFGYVFVFMILAHPVGVALVRRRFA
jgi:hypothetical protein